MKYQGAISCLDIKASGRGDNLHLHEISRCNSIQDMDVSSRLSQFPEQMLFSTLYAYYIVFKMK